MKVVKGLRKLLHPPELMVWVSCGFDSFGLVKHGSCQGFELLPRMGGKPPKPPWLRGAGAPLRSPPGGAFIQTVWMGDESFVELAPVE